MQDNGLRDRTPFSWRHENGFPRQRDGTPTVPFQDANLTSIHDQRSAIILFSRPFVFIRGSTIFLEEVGKMPTLLEDTGEPPMPLFEEAASSSSYPVTNDLSQTPRMREISASEIIALKRSSRGAVLRSATVTARSRVNLPERVRRSALRWAPQPSFSPMSWA